MKIPAAILVVALYSMPDSGATLTLERSENWVIVHGPQIPGGAFKINYLEAYCRAGSTDADWVKHTRMRHESELILLRIKRGSRDRSIFTPFVPARHGAAARFGSW